MKEKVFSLIQKKFKKAKILYWSQLRKNESVEGWGD